jgi:glycosyltransferase involved in cell wall biosynthesis
MVYPTFLYLQDFVECHFADYLILDTYSHIKFFHEKFNVPIKKFRRVFIGANDEIFFPLKKEEGKENQFLVGFWGTFIPLQGIQYIIKAAKILEKISQFKFIIIGNGQTYKENWLLAKKLKISNIKFLDFVPLQDLPQILNNFDIGLGIFGDTPKTIQVIPNKIFEGNAMKLPMISCDSPAIRELYTDNKNIILCERANPKSLAEAILKLKNNTLLREKIKENGYSIFQKYCSPYVLGKFLKNIFKKILQE